MLEFGVRSDKVRVIFMGTPDFAVTCLEYLITNQYDLVAVYTQPDKPTGRGRLSASSPVKDAALRLELPVVQPDSLRDEAEVSKLAGFSPDVIVVASYGQILPRRVLDTPRYGCVNVHPSLLPRFRGASPVTAAIMAGDEFAGVSIMLLDEGLDTGSVLARAQIPVSAEDTTGSLTDKLFQVGARMLLDVLPRWVRGELTPAPQNEAEATYSKLSKKVEGEIDWSLPAIDIWRRVRAFQPWPGCFTRWRGRRLEIIEAVPLPEEAVREAGMVVALNKEVAAFGVCTGAGVLGVRQVQLEGKRAMSAAEFLRGQRQLIGAVLPSN